MTNLLTKLRTRLLGISNLSVLGVENACPSLIQYVYDNIPKERHGLTQQCIDNKDKQKYTSIATLVGDDLKDCLNEVSNSVRTIGAIVYLGLMGSSRDAHFDKGITPLKRNSLLWEVTFL